MSRYSKYHTIVVCLTAIIAILLLSALIFYINMPIPYALAITIAVTGLVYPIGKEIEEHFIYKKADEELGKLLNKKLQQQADDLREMAQNSKKYDSVEEMIRDLDERG